MEAAGEARVGAVFTALGDATRRRVLERLSQEDGLSLTGIADGLPITRQAVAKHMRVLQTAGLVESTRAGRETRYRLRPSPMTEAAAWMTAVGAEWDGRLARLRRLVDGDRVTPGSPARPAAAGPRRRPGTAPGR